MNSASHPMPVAVRARRSRAAGRTTFKSCRAAAERWCSASLVTSQSQLHKVNRSVHQESVTDAVGSSPSADEGLLFSCPSSMTAFGR